MPATVPSAATAGPPLFPPCVPMLTRIAGLPVLLSIVLLIKFTGATVYSPYGVG